MRGWIECSTAIGDIGNLTQRPSLSLTHTDTHSRKHTATHTITSQVDIREEEVQKMSIRKRRGVPGSRSWEEERQPFLPQQI